MLRNRDVSHPQLDSRTADITCRLLREQSLRMAGYLNSFDNFRGWKEDVFVNLCTCIADEKVKAEAFLRDALQHKIKELQRSDL